jgi:copper chaperone
MIFKGDSLMTKTITLGLMTSLLLILSAQADTRTYEINGMTCGSCEKSVKKQVCSLPGVTDCQVEVGKIVLKGESIDDTAVKAAVSKAGEYSVVSVEHSDASADSSQKPNPGPTMPTAPHKKMKK